MKKTLATTLAAVAVVGLSATSAQAGTPTAVPTSIVPISLTGGHDEVRMTLEFQCQKGYGYDLSGYTNTRSEPVTGYGTRASVPSLTGKPGKEYSGTCTGNVQHLNVKMPRVLGPVAASQQGEYGVVMVLQLTGGPCYPITAWPYTNCVGVGFATLTIA